MKLYEICNEYESLLNNLYNLETGEVKEESLIRLNHIQENLEKKCVAVASYIENIEAELKAITEAKNKIRARENRFKKMVYEMKDYLLFNMQKSSIDKISCEYFDIKILKNPNSVYLNDISLIPDRYKKVEEKIDLEKIKEDLISGIQVEGASLIKKNRISIK